MSKSSGEKYQDGLAGKPGWGVSWEYGREAGGWTPLRSTTTYTPSAGSGGFDLSFLVAFIVVFALTAWSILTFYFTLPFERRFINVFVNMGVSPSFAPLAEDVAAFFLCCYTAAKVADRFGGLITKIVGLSIVGFILYCAYVSNHGS